MTTIQRKKDIVIDVDALDVDALLEIPEIRASWDAYVEIKREYREALFDAIRQSPDGEFPDVSDLMTHFRGRLADQRIEMKHLAVKYS